MAVSENITWHPSTIERKDREKLNGHKGTILWFTGLSGSGKSTLATAVEDKLHQRGTHTHVMDGDNVRHGLCKDLGFSDNDRTENIRRIGEVAKLFTDAGVIALTAFISPFRADRDEVRKLVEEGDFIEVYVHCPLDVCEQRDPKGLYKKARAGEIPEFTGISSPYEAPEKPEITVDSSLQSIEESVDFVIDELKKRGIIT